MNVKGECKCAWEYKYMNVKENVSVRENINIWMWRRM